MMPLSMILEIPTQLQMIGLLSIFVHIQNFYLLFFTFHQNKALKKLWKMLFVSTKQLFWFLQYSNFRRKLGSWIIMRLQSGLHILLTLIFGKTQKLLWIKWSKMVRWLNTKEKNFWTYLAILKAVLALSEIGFKNEKQI